VVSQLQRRQEPPRPGHLDHEDDGRSTRGREGRTPPNNEEFRSSPISRRAASLPVRRRDRSVRSSAPPRLQEAPMCWPMRADLQADRVMAHVAEQRQPPTLPSLMGRPPASSLRRRHRRNHTKMRVPASARGVLLGWNDRSAASAPTSLPHRRPSSHGLESAALGVEEPPRRCGGRWQPRRPLYA
jgi:hypothetical protein